MASLLTWKVGMGWAWASPGQFSLRGVSGKLPWQHSSVCVYTLPTEFQDEAIYSPRLCQPFSFLASPGFPGPRLRKLREA